MSKIENLTKLKKGMKIQKKWGKCDFWLDLGAIEKKVFLHWWLISSTKGALSFWSFGFYENINFGQVKEGNKKFRKIKGKFDIWVNLCVTEEKFLFNDDIYLELTEL